MGVFRPRSSPSSRGVHRETETFNAFGGRKHPQPPRGPPPGAMISGRHGGGRPGGGRPSHNVYAMPPTHYAEMPGHALPPPGPPPNMEQVLSKFHDAINNSVWEAVQEIVDMSEGSDAGKLTKRIVKYMYSSASKGELMGLPWEELCAEFVKGMWHSYSASCGELEWFYHIDLVPSLTAGAMILLPAAGWRIPPNQVFDIMSREYEGNMDRKTLEKALWEMCENLYGDDEKVRTKMYRALSNSYEPALRSVLNDPTPMPEIHRVELFTAKWIDDATTRAWGGLGDQAEDILNTETLVEIYDHLLRPFGEDHPFSAIPRALTEGIGAPPRGWDFIPQAVEDLFANWNNPGAATKKRKKKSGGGGDALDEEQPFTAFAPAKKAKKQPQPSSTGHPSCTSGPDCAGEPENDLIQHVLEDGPGDIYCECCWNSFKERNPDLEGVPVED